MRDVEDLGSGMWDAETQGLTKAKGSGRGVLGKGIQMNSIQSAAATKYEMKCCRWGAKGEGGGEMLLRNAYAGNFYSLLYCPVGPSS